MGTHFRAANSHLERMQLTCCAQHTYTPSYTYMCKICECTFPHAYIKRLQLVEQHDGPLDSLSGVAELVAVECHTFVGALLLELSGYSKSLYIHTYVALWFKWSIITTPTLTFCLCIFCTFDFMFACWFVHCISFNLSLVAGALECG